MYSPDDTIVALATPPGRGGLGIVRLSGSRARDLARALIEPGPELAPRHATLVRVVASPPGRGGSSVAIDEAIATFFPAPASYTGEDVVEFSLHGSAVVQGEVIGAALSLGARMAAPGEFTLRAFLNGRLDLTRAEAVNDLVEATTPVQARVAFDQLSGTLAERIAEIEGELFELVARLEASGDFPEEGYHFITPEDVRTTVETARGRIAALLGDARRGRLIREGVSVAIVGRPNVGKSTLFNRLAGAERAIVTAIPGTTRDVLMESVMLLGTRMMLADTAGLRNTDDPVEREGVARAEKAGAAADLVLVVLDASQGVTEGDRVVLESSEGRPRVVVFNKCDLGEPAAESIEGLRPFGVQAWAKEKDGETGSGMEDPAVRISARTGEGIDELVRVMAKVVGLGQTPENPAVTNARHVALLERADAELSRAAAQLSLIGQTPEEVVLSDINGAIDALGEVSGKRTSDDLLDAIFSKFCIGK